MSWKRALENGGDLCVNEGQKLSEYRVSLAEGRKKKKERSRFFDCVWFSRKTAVLEMFSGSILHVDNVGET